jgi:hypothetical protein
MGEPSRCSRLLRHLLKRYAGRIFAADHSIWPYFVSATILRELENLCIGKARASVWKFRFILALLVRRSHGKPPRLNDDKGQQTYAQSIIKSCHNRKEFLSRLTQAEKKIADAIMPKVVASIAEMHIRIGNSLTNYCALSLANCERSSDWRVANGPKLEIVASHRATSTQLEHRHPAHPLKRLPRFCPRGLRLAQPPQQQPLSIPATSQSPNTHRTILASR